MLEHSIARSSILWHARDNSDALKFYTSANPCKHTYAYIKYKDATRYKYILMVINENELIPMDDVIRISYIQL
jgi:hypothetical protein